ncbi:MAG: copper amine oxidase N-terminal domain-containing protein, partial [Bacillota bacterium]
MRRWWVSLLALALMVLPAAPALAGGGIRVRVDGVELQTDAAPFIHRDRTMVPVRALAEALGFAVDWDGGTRRVTLARGENVLVLQIDSTRVLVNGHETTLDVPALIRNSRTFVPLRFVAERLGATVVWDGTQRTVLVTRRSGGPAPGIDPEAKAILDKVLAAGHEVRDQKVAGEMAVEVAASAGGVNMTLAVPAEMQIHSYQGDMLMTMAIHIPEVAGGEVIQAQAAARGGLLYGQHPETGEWELLGPYTHGEIPDVAAYPMLDLADVTELEAQVLQRATVTVGGTETLDG